MEEEIKIDEHGSKRVRKSGLSLVSNGSRMKANYDDEVLVSHASLSCETTLLPATLELR